MKIRFVTLLFTFLLGATIAQAGDNLLDKQYYGYLRDTCKKNNVERTWNRWFGDKQKSLSEDTCCMESIAEMEKISVLEAEDGTCPEGFQKNSLECPSTKIWCEKLAP
jgi:hypothetical protein